MGRYFSILTVPAALAGLAACAQTGPAPETASTPAPPDPLLVEGQSLASELCSTCHAIGREGESLHPDAKPFRMFSRNYPVESLAEPLAEGIVVGHPDMPAWEFEPDEIDALIAYIESVQHVPG